MLLQFGYDQGYICSVVICQSRCRSNTLNTRVMSGLITGPHFRSFFHDPTAFELGTMIAVLEIGAFSEYRLNSSFRPLPHSFAVTSIAAGRVGDMIGRRMTLFWGAVLFTIGGGAQTFTTGYGLMLLGRIVSGFGVGLLS